MLQHVPAEERMSSDLIQAFMKIYQRHCQSFVSGEKTFVDLLTLPKRKAGEKERIMSGLPIRKEEIIQIVFSQILRDLTEFLPVFGCDEMLLGLGQCCNLT
jgi:hypothetical protein